MRFLNICAKTIVISWLLIAFSAADAIGAPSPATAVVEEGDYVIRYGASEMGSSHYAIRESKTEPSAPSLEVTTTTVLYATIRKNQKLEFHQTLTALLDRETLEVKTYVIENESPFKSEKTTLHFSTHGAEVLRSTGGTSVKGTWPCPGFPAIADIANPAGGNLNIPLFACALKRHNVLTSDTSSFEALATGSFQTFRLSAKKVAEKEEGVLVYEMNLGKEGIPLTYRVHVRSSDGKIISMESPDEHYSYTAGTGRKIVSPPDISAAFLVPLSSDLRNCGSVRAKVKLRILQETTTEERLRRYHQTFSGSMKDGILEGTLTTSSASLKAQPSSSFPSAGLNEEWKAYCAPEVLIESDDGDIKRQALNLTKDAKTVAEAVQRLGIWVYENIEFAYTDGSAKATMLSKKGDWIPRNRLFIGLARSLGIPARFAGGFLLTETVAGNYFWSEVYLGKDSGWAPVDVALGQIDYFSANYLTLWNHGYFDPFSLKPEIQVIEFKEEPRPRNTKFIVR